MYNEFKVCPFCDNHPQIEKVNINGSQRLKHHCSLIAYEKTFPEFNLGQISSCWNELLRQSLNNLMFLTANE